MITVRDFASLALYDERDVTLVDCRTEEELGDYIIFDVSNSEYANCKVVSFDFQYTEGLILTIDTEERDE